MKTLCRGSMRAGERAAGVPAPAPPLVSCLLCGRSFPSMRMHTAQVPRHLPRPKVAHHRRRWLRPVNWLTLSPVGGVGDLAVAVPALAATLKLPPWIPVGDWILDRVPGDFPDDVVFSGSAGAYTLWVKSSNLLAGPWDWVIEEGRSPVYLGGPFATREEATADLASSAAAAGIAAPATGDDLLSVAAATEEHAEPAPRRPPARDSAPTCRDHVASAAAPDPDDHELMGLALDLAIVALRRARARLPGRLAA